MGSFGKLAKRALKTEMPVMVQVLSFSSHPSPSLIFPVKNTPFYDNQQGGCVFALCRCRNCSESEEVRMPCPWPRYFPFFSLFVFLHFYIMYAYI